MRLACSGCVHRKAAERWHAGRTSSDANAARCVPWAREARKDIGLTAHRLTAWISTPTCSRTRTSGRGSSSWSKSGRLSGAESDELVERYQQVATHLSVVRTSAPDASLVAHLSSLLARARNKAAGTRVGTWRGRGDVLHRAVPGRALPAALVVAGLPRGQRRRDRGDDAVAARPPAGRAEPAVARARSTSWSTTTSRTTTASTPPATSPRRSGSTTPGSPRSASRSGILGLPVIYLLFQNILNLAVIGSIMTRHDRGDLFWGLILPHGLLELTAVFVAGGVGLRLFWSWVEPGGLTRTASIAREGRTAGTVALGLVAVLLVSGIIEAFVTPSAAAHLGPGRHRHHRRAGVLRLRVRARPQRRPPRPHRRHRRRRCSRTGSPPRPERVGGE